MRVRTRTIVMILWATVFLMMVLIATSVSGCASPAPVTLSGSTPTPVPLTDARWDQLWRIDTELHRAFRYRSDTVLYGVTDKWTRPLLISGLLYGDCEDYALELRHRLLKVGWPSDALRLALCSTPSGERHAALVILTDRGAFVADNLSDFPRDIKVTGYSNWSWGSGTGKWSPFSVVGSGRD